MDASTRAMVEAIHANPTQAVLYLSGGASQAFGWLLSVPGALNTVLEVIVACCRMSVIQLLGKVFSETQLLNECSTVGGGTSDVSPCDLRSWKGFFNRRSATSCRPFQPSAQ
ncbi:hypothetical protein ACS0TY_003109 [Phlomoides rotata]